MSNEWNVQAFLNQLKSTQPQVKVGGPKEPTLSKTYLGLEENLGKYQIFPVNSTVTGMPFEYLYKSREVNLPFGKLQDGTDRYSWHKLLPMNAYNFLDSTGRLVSSLTQSETDLLYSAYGVFDRLWNLIPESSRKDVCRIKNYAVGNAYVINKYGLRDQNKPVKSRFSTTLVCTSKDFANAINKDIEMQMINHGNDVTWLSEIYNRLPSGRTGWLIFTITNAANGIGFSVSASHTSNLPKNVTEGLVIPDEDMNLMTDPIRSFLGRQAGKDKLFNEELITNVIDSMNRLISKYSNSAVYVDNSGIKEANYESMKADSVQAAPPTNDPMLSSSYQGTQIPKDEVNKLNSDPFVTPPASTFDPVTGRPVNYNEMGAAYQTYQGGFGQNVGSDQQQPQQQAAYTQPSFAQMANPFDNAKANPYNQ